MFLGHYGCLRLHHFILERAFSKSKSLFLNLKQDLSFLIFNLIFFFFGVKRHKSWCIHEEMLMMHRKLVGWMLWASMIWKAWKGKQTIKGDRWWPAKNPPMLKLVSLSNFGVPTFWELFQTYLFLLWMSVYIVHTRSGYLFSNFPYLWGGRRVWG